MYSQKSVCNREGRNERGKKYWNNQKLVKCYLYFYFVFKSILILIFNLLCMEKLCVVLVKDSIDAKDKAIN